MVFEKLPVDVLAAGSEIIICLAECDPDEITEVQTIKDGEVLGVKRMTGADSYEVNVACYLDDTLDIEPYYAESGAGFKEMPSWLGYFRVKATQYPAGSDGPQDDAKWIQTGEFPYTAGRIPCGVLSPLMDMDGELEVGPDENLLIPVLIDARYTWGRIDVISPEWNRFVTLSVTGEEGSLRSYAYFVNTANVQRIFECRLDETFEIVIEIGTTGNDIIFSKRIAVREMAVEGVRLCWVNKYGMVDYFTFSPRQNTTTAIGKTRTFGERGYKFPSIETGETVSVTTPLLTPENLIRLNGLLSSPKVWHVGPEGNLISRIDIITQKSEIEYDSPGTMEISFRYC